MGAGWGVGVYYCKRNETLLPVGGSHSGGEVDLVVAEGDAREAQQQLHRRVIGLVDAHHLRAPTTHHPRRHVLEKTQETQRREKKKGADCDLRRCDVRDVVCVCFFFCFF